MSDFRQLTLTKKLRLFLMPAILLVAGITGNYFGIPLFWGMDFMLGSAAVLIALRLYGLLWGTATAIIIGGFSAFILHLPQSIIIFPCEALIVGFLLRRKNENLIVADAFFWTLIGIPLTWLLFFGFIDINMSTALFLSLKISVNGIFNALLASLIITHLPVSQWVRHGQKNAQKKGLALQQLLFNLSVAFVLLPALMFVIIDNQREQKEIETEIKSLIKTEATQINNYLNDWYQQHLHAVNELALIAARTDMRPSAELQKNTATIMTAVPDFLAMYVGNTAGKSIAFYPPIDDRGNSTIGLNFADREYFKDIKTTLHADMSDIFIGRANVRFPIITLTVPIISDNVFRGYALGVLDLGYISKMLKLSTQDGKLNLTILDRKNKVIASTDSDLTTMQVFKPKKDGNIYALNTTTYLGSPAADKTLLHSFYWQKLFYVQEIPVNNIIPWKLVLKVPVAPYHRELLFNNIKDLSGMLALAIIALLFANALSHRLVGPISKLTWVTTDLPVKLFLHQTIDWPTSPITEIDSLAGNFQSMAGTLQQNFAELQEAILKIEEEKIKLEAIIAGIGDGISIQDTNFRILYQNQIMKEFTGDHVGKFCYMAYESSPGVCAGCPMAASFEDGKIHRAVRIKHSGQKRIHLDTTTSPLRDTTGKIIAGIEVARDITDKVRFMEERKKAEQLIWQEKERAQVTLHSIGDAVITTDAAGVVEFLNPVAESLTGWTNETAKGLPLLQVFHVVNETTGSILENPVEKCIREGRIVGLANHTLLIHRDGHEYAIEDSASPIKDREGRIIGAVLVFHNVTEKRNMLRQLMHQAHHDALTELPNRILFNDRLTLALTQAKRNKAHLAVLFLDLNRFKLVNDMLGHAMGDQLLKGVAQRLKNCVRDSDTVSRLGGDEFTLLLPQISHEEDAAKVARKILKSLYHPWVLCGQEFHITASIGIALYPNDGEDAETLLKHADTAMYRAKEHGQNNYQLFAPTMNTKIMERLALENSLRYALKRKEFIVFYQPQVDTEAGQIIGMEALVRWQHPERELIPPAQFIPLAEETGLIVPIGKWVLHTACAQNKAWQDAGYAPMRVTVNLSAYQFRQHNLVETITHILHATGLNPHWLELEITESVAMQDVDFTIAVLRDLRKMGIWLAIDDFGTGYSSLNYLKRFPIHTLKIDRSFVRDITSNPEDAAIVSTIIVLGQSMKLSVIAEGVETEEQLVFLKQRHCNKMQGYLFSKPVPAEEFEVLLKK